MVYKKEETREQHKINVGPIMKKVIEKQKSNICSVTKGVCKPSDWEACEVIAKKVTEEKLV